MSVLTSDLIVKIRGLIKDLEKTNGRDAFQYEGDSSFTLGQDYVNSTGIKVFQNGTELSEDDWSYNSDTNQVTITFVTSGFSLVSGDDILVKYSYYEKYSDTEITSYIKANLLRLVAKRYAKTFYMTSSDEIVTSNGENPTDEEGDIIAFITAIDIDPQNITIKIGNDFTVTANENLSKSEQINNILDRFIRTFGTIDFLETEE